MQESPAKVRFFSTHLQGFYTDKLKPHPLAWMIGASALILFLASSLRHLLFNSTGWDLGIYDQVVYLMSQGQPPISSFLQMHHLGNHGAFSVYLVALLYKIYPTVYWLLLIQATALALGALPIWHLARLAGLREGQALAMSAIYLLYPVIFNANLFDFHPEVMAIPVIAGAVLAAQLGRVGWFSLAIVFILGCKAALSLTVMALGFWLLVFKAPTARGRATGERREVLLEGESISPHLNTVSVSSLRRSDSEQAGGRSPTDGKFSLRLVDKKRLCGAIALIAGISWFLIVTQIIIPTFSGEQAAAVSRYSYLGDSVLEIAKNLLFKPGAIFKVLFSLDNLKYLILLFAPVIWGLSPQNLTPLVPAVPALTLNLLADYQPQKDIVAQYSLPIVPFLMLAVIATLAEGRGWLRSPRTMVLWSLIFFLGLARWSYFFTKYLPTLDTWQATREAIALIQTKQGVYTTNEIAPHLSERALIERTVTTEPHELTKFEYVLLNQRHPGSNSSPEFAAQLIEQLRNNSQFRLRYQRDDVFLFENTAN